MEKNLTRWTLIIGVLIGTLLIGPSWAEEPAKVLFVGNSFTYYNNSLHSHYRHFRAASMGDVIALQAASSRLRKTGAYLFARVPFSGKFRVLGWVTLGRLSWRILGA